MMTFAFIGYWLLAIYLFISLLVNEELEKAN